MAGGVVDQVKARLDIVDVVSEKVVLKKAGKSLKGLCPFHVEKTPSFIVFPETGTWHCFGCGAGGDAFTFVMNSQNLDFGGALAVLAARAGVELHSERRGAQEAQGAERLYAVNEAAAQYFRSMLSSPAGSRARSYLEGRQISSESVESFQIGFAPDTGAALAHHLLQQGFERAETLEAGMAGESESGALYDRFRARVIFPIRDVGGGLVGFGGRALSPETQPKYLNTPQTPVFDKGGCLYAVDRARQAIRQTGQAVIVEGYVDALMAHQHGFRNVVAALGTAVTERQVSQLKRWASELCFAMDPDLAGQEATARGLAVAMDALERAAVPVPSWKGFVEYVYKLKTAIKIIALPRGKDPDEVIRGDPALWRQLVRDAVLVQDFFLERVKHKHDFSTAAGKAAAVEEAMAVIGDIPEPVEQAHYVQRLASMVGLDEETLLQQMRQRRHRKAGMAAAPSGERAARPMADVEGYCLALLLKAPSLLDREPRLVEGHFVDPAHRELFRRLVESIRTSKESPDASEMPDRLRDGLQEPLSGTLGRLLELQARHPIHFDDPLDKAYQMAATTLVLGSLERRRRQLEAMRAGTGEGLDPTETGGLIRMEKQIAEEAHRLKLLGGTIPLRAIQKEVRHGG